MRCVDPTELSAFIEGALSPERMAAVGAHLDHCDECAERHASFEDLGRRIAPGPGELDDPDLAGDVMTLIRLGQGAPEKTRRPRLRVRWPVVLPLVTVPLAAAAVFLLVNPLSLHHEASRAPDDGFQARGASVQDPARWTSFEIYQPRGGELARARGRISASLPVAFTYTNGAESPFSHLMICAVDPAGRIFWYYPAYEEAADDPGSVRIIGEDDRVQLPDAVRHELSEGEIVFLGIFSNKPLRVSAVEGMIRRHLETDPALDSLSELEPPGSLVQLEELVVLDEDIGAS